MGKLSLKPYEAPYKGHVQFRSDKSTSEYGTSTDAGRSKVTEGKEATLQEGKKHGKGHSGGKAPKKGQGY